MGLRSRMMGRFRELLGGAQSPPPTSSASTRPAPTRPAASAPPRPAPATPSQTTSPTPPASPAPPTSPSAMPAPSAGSAEEKAAKHLIKTRKALLQKLKEADGALTLGELHDYSERRYFIGHKKFSDLFEAMVDQGVVDWDPQSATATLTERGHIELSAPNT
jgi:hypothetical protein